MSKVDAQRALREARYAALEAQALPHVGPRQVRLVWRGKPEPAE